MTAPSDSPESDPREALINLAIFDYHAAADRGQGLDPQAWVEQHPEIAAELQAYLDDLKGLSVLPGAPLHRDEFQPGEVLGDYVLLDKLGEGGQGVVWKASPRKFPEIVVALKTMRGPALDDQDAVYRFREDARAIARMNHPHIIRTSYVGEQAGRWFIVMELMEGGSVADRLATYRDEPRAVALLLEKIARAIHHAHTRNDGVIHLDLKPGNILLTPEGEPKVTDFGLAVRSAAASQAVATTDAELEREENRDVSATIAHAGIVGTLPYVSTEMAEGRWQDVSTLSDVYGLGAILYAMLTGRPPFVGGTTRETLAQVIEGALQAPRAINRRVDAELNAICLRCLERNPAQRYGSADALANDVRRWLERRPTLAGGKPSAARELRFWARRNPFVLALAGSACVLLWVASLLFSIGQIKVENGREAARLARQLDRELRMVRVFTKKLAEDAELRSAWEQFPDPRQAAERQQALQAVLDSVDLKKWFDVAGGNPFVNVLVLDQDGVELADTMPDRLAVGKGFRVRDYYRALFQDGLPQDYVHVARSFHSIKDRRYKIAVSTRIWGQDDKLLGVLVANFTIGPRLLGFDLRQESSDAAVLCPIDLSNPTLDQPDEPGQAWRYSFVLDRRYREDWTDKPYDFVSADLAGFQRDPGLEHVTVGPRGGRLIEYHRVGATELVVMTQRVGPWPLSWLP